MHKVSFDTGDVIFRQGDASHDCYRITAGAVEIRLKVPGVMRRDREDVLSTMGPGDYFGEMGAIDGNRRSATAVATEPTECERYTSEEVTTLFQEDSQAALEYMRQLIARLRSSNRSTAFSARIRD